LGSRGGGKKEFFFRATKAEKLLKTKREPTQLTEIFSSKTGEPRWPLPVVSQLVIRLDRQIFPTSACKTR
jgi:hypothetical protein